MWDGGENSLLCDPGSELRLGGREKKKGEDNKWDGKKKKKVSTRGRSIMTFDEKTSQTVNAGYILYCKGGPPSAVERAEPTFRLQVISWLTAPTD